MREYPIEGLMNTTLDSLKDMIDVNTIIGETIELENGTAIIPISKVGFGFASGGSEFNIGTIEEFKKQGLDEETKYRLPFGGGSGAGVNIQPVGFLVVSEDSAKMIPVNHCSAIDKLLDYIPDLLDRLSDICSKDKTYTYEFYEDEDGDCCGTCKCECDENNTNNQDNDDSANDTQN